MKEELLQLAQDIKDYHNLDFDVNNFVENWLTQKEGFEGQKNNSRLGDVSKPRFAEWMENNGYWQDEQFAWKSRNVFLTVDDLLSLKKEHKNL